MHACMHAIVQRSRSHRRSCYRRQSGRCRRRCSRALRHMAPRLATCRRCSLRRRRQSLPPPAPPLATPAAADTAHLSIWPPAQSWPLHRRSGGRRRQWRVGRHRRQRRASRPLPTWRLGRCIAEAVGRGAGRLCCQAPPAVAASAQRCLRRRRRRKRSQSPPPRLAAAAGTPLHWAATEARLRGAVAAARHHRRTRAGERTGCHVRATAPTRGARPLRWGHREQQRGGGRTAWPHHASGGEQEVVHVALPTPKQWDHPVGGWQHRDDGRCREGQMGTRRITAAMLRRWEARVRWDGAAQRRGQGTGCGANRQADISQRVNPRCRCIWAAKNARPLLQDHKACTAVLLKKSRTPTVATEFQISFCEVVK